MKTIVILFSAMLICQGLSAQLNPNIVGEDGYVVFADVDTVRGKVSIEFKEKEEIGTTTIKSMDAGREVSIQPYPYNNKPRTKQKVLCFFARGTRYEPISIKDGSAVGFMSKMASGNAGNVHFFKSFYQAGNFSVFQDPLDDYNFAVKKTGDEKAFYFGDILKNKKAAKSFVEACEALKSQSKDGLNELRDVKVFADYLNANCK
jgi:hypothetical protein